MDVFEEVKREVERAEAKHRRQVSAHEGYAILLEEVRELEAEVFKGGKTPRDWPAMRTEAIQCAAMACRLIRDVVDPQIAQLDTE